MGIHKNDILKTNKKYTQDSSVIKKHCVESYILGEQYTECIHRSGLDIYVYKKDMSVTYALLCVGVGSANIGFSEPNGNRILFPDGTAHFTEHKIFENLDGTDAFERFCALGADANAYTTHNRTVYLFSCSDNFNECLRELLSFVIHPCFKKESVEREKGIIAQEILMYDDDPYSKCYELLLDAMYVNDPVKKNACGTLDSIKCITPEILYKFYNTYYRASKMKLIVCGNVDENDIINAVDTVMGKGSKTADVEDVENITDIKISEPRTVNKKLITANMPVSRPILCMGYKLSPENNPSDSEYSCMREVALMILCEIIFSHSGELYNSLYESDMISSWFSATLSYSKNFVNISIGTETDVPEVVEKKVLAYVEAIKTKGISDEEFERGRRVCYSDYIASFDSTEEISELLLDSILSGNNLYEYAQATEIITKRYTEAVLSNSFSEDCFATAVIYPKDEDCVAEKNM